jgi:excinuclease UvrABC ATPase subunit
MNQDQVKDKLLMLEQVKTDFIVTFSGKSSKKVDGLYYPDKCEIIIHNANFVDDNQLMYTAIHEFAHHVQFTRTTAPVTARAHSNDFWNIFHTLLFKAEEMGIYNNIFDTNDEFKELTVKLRDEYLSRNGHLMKEFGSLLIKARELCQRYHASFEDYVDRVLRLHRNEAKTIMKTYTMDLKPEIGYENMKTVAKIKDEGLRQGVQEAFISDQRSPDMIKADINPKAEFNNRLSYLESEKERVERSLDKLTAHLAKLERDIDVLKNSGF